MEVDEDDVEKGIEPVIVEDHRALIPCETPCIAARIPHGVSFIYIWLTYNGFDNKRLHDHLDRKTKKESYDNRMMRYRRNRKNL